jgi:hypothetical protein
VRRLASPFPSSTQRPARVPSSGHHTSQNHFPYHGVWQVYGEAEHHRS